MKFLKNLFIVIAVLAIIIIVVGFFLPKTAHVERSIVINASQDKVFQQVNSFDDYNLFLYKCFCLETWSFSDFTSSYHC